MILLQVLQCHFWCFCWSLVLEKYMFANYKFGSNTGAMLYFVELNDPVNMRLSNLPEQMCVRSRLLLLGVRVKTK